MKTGFATKICLGLGLCLTVSAVSATTPATTPAANAPAVSAPISSEIAGFTTLDVAAASAPDKPQLSLIGIGLIHHVEYQGHAESVRANIITDTDATWTDNQFNPLHATRATATCYLEVTTGPVAGATFDILRTDAKKKWLVLAQGLPRNIGRNPGYCVRKHWTLAALFGADNEAGLQPGNAATADLVSIYNGKGYDRYFFSDGAAGHGWRRVGGGTVDASGRTIYPDDGLAVTRVAGSPMSLLVTGVVKPDRTLIPVQRGLNVVANVYQAPITLMSSQLFTHNAATGLRAGETAAKADNILIYNGTAYDAYYYQNSVRNGAGWRSATDPHTDAGDTAVPVGRAFVIERRGTAGFNWFAPAPH